MTVCQLGTSLSFVQKGDNDSIRCVATDTTQLTYYSLPDQRKRLAQLIGRTTNMIAFFIFGSDYQLHICRVALREYYCVQLSNNSNQCKAQWGIKNGKAQQLDLVLFVTKSCLFGAASGSGVPVFMAQSGDACGNL